VLALMTTAQGAFAADCPPPPEPVFSMAYGSRYGDVGQGSTEIDADANRQVDEALGPIDDFLRDLTRDANGVLVEGADRAALADCVLARMAVWARADAMGDLVSATANLTIGSRLAAFGMAARQVAPFARDPGDLADVRQWLNRRQRAQMAFWETASVGAARGNLRAWSALAGAAIGEVTGDPVMLGWAAWSATHVLCTAHEDGSLPQEMTRGRLALHYQLHAVAPLSVAAALLEPRGYAVAGQCGQALRRVGDFIARDLADGAQSAAITGEVQSFFDGSDEIEAFNLAWIEAWLTLFPGPELDAFAESFRPLGHSKLGGDQTALWR